MSFCWKVIVSMVCRWTVPSSLWWMKTHWIMLQSLLTWQHRFLPMHRIQRTPQDKRLKTVAIELVRNYQRYSVMFHTGKPVKTVANIQVKYQYGVAVLPGKEITTVLVPDCAILCVFYWTTAFHYLLKTFVSGFMTIFVTKD